MTDIAGHSTETTDNGGETLLWLLVWSELVIFGILLAGFLVSSVLHAEAFAAARTHLASRLAGLNTVILLASGWQAALAANARGKPRLQRVYLAAAGVLGLVFVALKLVEYRSEWPFAFEDSQSSFFELYFLLTGFHLAHVVFIGLVLLAIARRPNPSNVAIVTTVWHAIDLVWLVMFPILYIG